MRQKTKRFAGELHCRPEKTETESQGEAVRFPCEKFFGKER